MQHVVFTSAREELTGLAQWLEPASASATPRVCLSRYAAPAVIYGRRGGQDAPRRERANHVGCDLLARRTGGGAVLAGPWLEGVHLWLPKTHPLAKAFPIPSLVWFGQLVARSMQSVGCAALLADESSINATRLKVTQHALDWSCFAGLSHGELLDTSKRKLFGLSQARVQAGVLLSGGLVCGITPWDMLHSIHLGETHDEPHDASVMESLVSDGEFFNASQRREALWADLTTRLSAELGFDFCSFEPAPLKAMA